MYTLYPVYTGVYLQGCWCRVGGATQRVFAGGVGVVGGWLPHQPD